MGVQTLEDCLPATRPLYEDTFVGRAVTQTCNSDIPPNAPSRQLGSMELGSGLCLGDALLGPVAPSHPLSLLAF